MSTSKKQKVNANQKTIFLLIVSIKGFFFNLQVKFTFFKAFYMQENFDLTQFCFNCLLTTVFFESTLSNLTSKK